MSTTNAKAAVKTVTPKAQAKPAATVTPSAVTKPVTPAATVSATPAPVRLGKSGIAVLTAISKEPLTRAEIGVRTGIKSGFCSLLGHVDLTKTEPSSLSAKGYLTVGMTEGKSASTYAITDRGKEALRLATAVPVNPATPPAQPKVEAPKPTATAAPATPAKAAAKKSAPAKK